MRCIWRLVYFIISCRLVHLFVCVCDAIHRCAVTAFHSRLLLPPLSNHATAPALPLTHPSPIGARSSEQMDDSLSNGTAATNALPWLGATLKEWQTERDAYSTLLIAGVDAVSTLTKGWTRRHFIFALAAAAQAKSIGLEGCSTASIDAAGLGAAASIDAVSSPALVPFASGVSSAGFLLSKLCAHITGDGRAWLEELLKSSLLQSEAALESLLAASPLLAQSMSPDVDNRLRFACFAADHPSADVLHFVHTHSAAGSSPAASVHPYQVMLEAQWSMPAEQRSLARVVAMLDAGRSPLRQCQPSAGWLRQDRGLLFYVLLMPELPLETVRLLLNARAPAGGKNRDHEKHFEPELCMAYWDDPEAVLRSLMDEQRSRMLQAHAAQNGACGRFLLLLCEQTVPPPTVILRLLLRWDETATPIKGKMDRTPLLVLLRASAGVEALEVLLSHAPGSIDDKDKHGIDALFSLCDCEEWTTDRDASLQRLLQHRPDWLLQKNERGDTALERILAVQIGIDLPVYERLLTLMPSADAVQLATEANNNGKTLLHHCCAGCAEAALIARLLHDAPAAASVLDGEGHSPLHYLASNPRFSQAALQLLLNAAPSMLAQSDYKSRTPLMRLCGNTAGRSVESLKALIAALPSELLSDEATAVSSLQAALRALLWEQTVESDPADVQLEAMTRLLLNAAGPDVAAKMLLGDLNSKVQSPPLRVYLQRKLRPVNLQLLALLTPPTFEAQSVPSGRPLLFDLRVQPSVTELQQMHDTNPASFRALLTHRTPVSSGYMWKSGGETIFHIWHTAGAGMTAEDLPRWQWLLDHRPEGALMELDANQQTPLATALQTGDANMQPIIERLLELEPQAATVLDAHGRSAMHYAFSCPTRTLALLQRLHQLHSTAPNKQVHAAIAHAWESRNNPLRLCDVEFLAAVLPQAAFHDLTDAEGLTRHLMRWAFEYCPDLRTPCLPEYAVLAALLQQLPDAALLHSWKPDNPHMHALGLALASHRNPEEPLSEALLGAATLIAARVPSTLFDPAPSIDKYPAWKTDSNWTRMRRFTVTSGQNLLPLVQASVAALQRIASTVPLTPGDLSVEQLSQLWLLALDMTAAPVSAPETAILFRDLVTARPVLLQWRNSEGQSLLHLSAKAGHLLACRSLLDAKAPIVLLDSHDFSALHYCSTVEHPECHALLADATRLHSMFRGRFELDSSRAPLLTAGGRLKWATDRGVADASTSVAATAAASTSVPAAVSVASSFPVVLKFFTDRSEFDRERATHEQLSQAARGKFLPRLLCAYEPLSGAEAGSDDSLPCLVMAAGSDSVRHQMNRRLLRTPPQRSWPATDVLPLARHTVDALRWLHSEDGPAMVHADIKPENIVQFADDHRIIDFGSATLIGEPLSADFSAHYTPPEQARRIMQQRTAAGEGGGTAIAASPSTSTLSPLLADPSYDVWSFGIVLWQLRIGSPPFDSSTGDVTVDCDNILSDIAEATDESILQMLHTAQKQRALQLHDNEGKCTSG